jgi:organic hydroperoxide reductase OsmC/OhrA
MTTNQNTKPAAGSTSTAETIGGILATFYFLRARLNVSLPGLEREVAQANATHGETCAYSNAARGNSEVTQATTDLVVDFLRRRS